MGVPAATVPLVRAVPLLRVWAWTTADEASAGLVLSASAMANPTAHVPRITNATNAATAIFMLFFICSTFLLGFCWAYDTRRTLNQR